MLARAPRVRRPSFPKAPRIRARPPHRRRIGLGKFPASSGDESGLGPMLARAPRVRRPSFPKLPESEPLHATAGTTTTFRRRPFPPPSTSRVGDAPLAPADWFFDWTSSSPTTSGSSRPTAASRRRTPSRTPPTASAAAPRPRWSSTRFPSTSSWTAPASRPGTGSPPTTRSTSTAAAIVRGPSASSSTSWTSAPSRRHRHYSQMGRWGGRVQFGGLRPPGPQFVVSAFCE
mmetsp:Transcript_19100/g.61469  ORF Transcript_19100/g.61469 Transcript_19100/m.61469 type:complete len:231 (-) Transcript_19100:364-1056(-)